MNRVKRQRHLEALRRLLIKLGKRRERLVEDPIKNREEIDEIDEWKDALFHAISILQNMEV